MSFRDKITAKRSQEAGIGFQNATGHVIEDLELFAKSPYFGVENTRNQPPCLELRLSDGSSKAIPYSYITETSFDPSEGIIITNTTKQVKINGRELNILYQFIIAYRVKYIQASTGTDAGEKGLFVSSISVSDL